MLRIQSASNLIGNANSYATIAQADDYFTNRNMPNWDNLSDEEKEVALIKAFDHIESMYSFRGVRLGAEQNSCFPRDMLRIDGVAVKTVPVCVIHAQIEFAYIASSGEIQPNIDYSQRVIVKESVEVAGAIKKSKEYSDNNQMATQIHHSADRWLKSVLSSSGRSASISIMRAI